MKKIFPPCLLAISLLLSSCFLFPDLTTVMKNKWGLDVPAPEKIIYERSSQGFHGDGYVYKICSFENTDNDLSTLPWQRESSPVVILRADAILAALSEDGKEPIPEKYLPDYSKEYWHISLQADDSSTLYMLYSPESRYLYILQELL